jgi:class 3 adenylate cyclase
MRKEMSILFSDVRGFTQIVERMPAAEHIGFINAYLGRMEPAIVDNGGFVDSYLGDGIMALFEGNADNALLAAIRMTSALARFNEERRAESLPPIEMGVGISTGLLTLGTIGGPMRIKCGVIGDPVNIASRVELLTKHLGSAVLVSHHTRDGLRSPEQFALRTVDRVRVKGKLDPITLYEVLDAEPPKRADGKRRTLEIFEEARALYSEGRFEKAERLFHECLAICPDDGAAAHLAGRARRYRAEPPKSWDGIETLLEK